MRLSVVSAATVTDAAFSQAASGGPYTTIPDGTTGTIINFYSNWANYLHLGYGFLHAVFGFLQGALVKGIFNIDKGLESIYDSVFSLLGWEGNVSSGSSPLHALWVFFQAFGWSILALGAAIVAFESMTHRTDWTKVGTSIVLAGIAMAVLPTMMTMFTSVAKEAESGINSISTPGMTSDIAVQPVKNNVIDLSTLIRHNFNNFTYKPDSKEIRNVADWNVIQDGKDVKKMDFGQYLDKTTMSDDLKLDKYKAGEEAMKYHLEDEHNQTDGGYIIAKNSSAGMGTLNDKYYSRYSVNWVGLFGQGIILGIVLLIAGIRVVKDTFELALMNFIVPLIAYRSIRSTKKIRDLISSIAGMYTSIVFMMTIIRVYLISLNVCQAKVPSMNWFQRSIVILMIYAGGAFAMFAGLNYLERVTGASQGLADEAGQAIATGAVAGAAGGAAAGLMGKTLQMAGNATSRFTSRNGASSFGNNRSNSSSMGGLNNNTSRGQDNRLSHSDSNQQVQSQNDNHSQGGLQNNNAQSNAGNNAVNSNANDSQGLNRGFDSSDNSNVSGVNNPNDQGAMDGHSQSGMDNESPIQDTVDDPNTTGIHDDSTQSENDSGISDQDTDDKMPIDNSFEGQADRINDMKSNAPDTTTDSAYQSGRDNSNPQSRDRLAGSAHYTAGVGNHIANTGKNVSNASRSIRQHSSQYLKNHQFNLSQNGNLQGRESDRLDE